MIKVTRRGTRKACPGCGCGMVLGERAFYCVQPNCARKKSKKQLRELLG